jgi:uncharacterized protein with HEPN domain
VKKDPRIFVEHILECVERIEEYTKGISKEEFFNSTQAQDAVIRRIEIIGEAVKSIPIDIKNRYPDIPWKQITGMRDILVHEYFGVDLELTWKAAREDVLELRNKILKVKNDLEEGAQRSGH